MIEVADDELQAAEIGMNVFVEGERQIDDVTEGGNLLGFGHAPAHRVKRTRSELLFANLRVSDAQLDVLFFQDASWLENAQTACGENGLAIAHTEGLEHLHLLEKFWIDLVQRHLSVNVDDGNEVGLSKFGAGVSVDCGAECGDG